MCASLASSHSGIRRLPARRPHRPSSAQHSNFSRRLRMHGSRPGLFQLRQLIFAAVVITGLTAIIAGGTLCSLDGFSQSPVTIISIARRDMGSAPADFQFERTGEGGVGQWKVVTDESSFSGLVIEQASAKAAITGDFVLTADEVNPIIRALRSNGIEVTAVHSHMLDE